MEPLQESQSWQELLAGYVLGDLTPEEVAQVNQYLSEHPEAENEVLALQRSLALLPFALPEAAPPESLKLRLLEEVEAVIAEEARTTGSNQVNSFPIASERTWGLSKLLAGALAIAAIVLGGSNWQLRQELAAMQQDLNAHREAIAMLRQPNNRLLALQGMNNSAEATGSFVITPSMGAAVLTVQNLEQLPPGMVYSMWAYVDGKQVDCVEFRPGSDGKVFMKVPLESFLTDTHAVEITIEKAGTARPSGEMVMKGDRSV
jgi:anti-sigma-K factor RskA